MKSKEVEKGEGKFKGSTSTKLYNLSNIALPYSSPTLLT